MSLQGDLYNSGSFARAIIRKSTPLSGLPSLCKHMKQVSRDQPTDGGHWCGGPGYTHYRINSEQALQIAILDSEFAAAHRISFSVHVSSHFDENITPSSVGAQKGSLRGPW